MKLIFTVLMLMVLAVGCMGHSPKPFHYFHTAYSYQNVPYKIIKVYIDKDFGPADKLSIDDSIKQWNFAMNGMIRLDVESFQFDMEPEIIRQALNGGSWLILKIDSSNPMVDDGPYVNGKPTAITLAWVNDIGGNRMWVIRDRIANEWMTGVSLHEMGHLLGADHDHAYLMKPVFNWEDARCVDYQAAKSVAEYQKIPMVRMNYCQYGISAR